jgi:hypothetical protein
VALTARELNFDEFKSEGVHEEHAVATGNVGTSSAFAWSWRKTKETCVERPVAGPSGYILTSIQQSDRQTYAKDSLRFWE